MLYSRRPNGHDGEMHLKDFKIGSTFLCDQGRWRVTDIGTRVVVAVRVDTDDTTKRSTNADMRSGVEEPGTKDSRSVECVFAEADIAKCSPA